MRGIEQFLQVDAATLGALKYAGTWNASTNTPTLASGVGVQGQYYVVSVAGSTNLDGETNWQVGDWAVFNGSVWQKVDGGSTGLLSTLTVTGNTYLATTSGDVGVGATSVTAIYGKTLQVGSGTSEATTSLVGSTGSLFLATVGATGQLIARGSTALVLGSNDVERMRITSAGDVGIGTSSPATKLHVVGDIQQDNANYIKGKLAAGTATRLFGLNAANSLYIGGIDASQSETLFTRGGTTQMTLDASGNLGLGVAPAAHNPSGFGGPMLQVGSRASLMGSSVYSTLGNNVYYDSGFFRYIATDEASMLEQENGAFKWFTAPSGTAGNAISFTQAMTLDASGNLGLGVTPQAWSANHRVIELAGASSAHVVAYVNGLSSGTNYYINSGNVLTYSYTGQNATRYLQNTTGQHQWYTAPSGTAGNAISFTQAMTLDASGNLGVGSTAPIAYSGYSGITVQNTNGGFIHLRDGGPTNQLEIAVAANTGYVKTITSTPLIFGTSNTERMRLDASGNLGIGTSSPGAKLEVKGTSAAGAVGITVFNTATDGMSTVAFGDGISTKAQIWAGNASYAPFGGADSLNYSANSGPHVWFNNYTEKMRLDSSGNLGLGVAPSAWVAGSRVLQLGATGYTALSQGTGGDSNLTSNVYLSAVGTWTAIASLGASRYQLDFGAHRWFTAPSGTAGNAVSFTQAMTLDASGNLLVGGTSGPYSAANRGYINISGSTDSVLGLSSGSTARGFLQGTATTVTLGATTGSAITFDINGEKARIPAAGGMVIGTAALATTATDGFIYVPTCAGTPTGTPTTQTGTAPIVIDTTNNKLYFYSGGQWRDAGP